jgi:hypothetical protein
MERPENFYFDTRIRRRILAKGLVTQQQVDSYLQSLSDQEGGFIVLDVAQPAVSPPAAPPSTGDAVPPMGPVDVAPSDAAALSMPATLQSPLGGVDDDASDVAPPTPVMINPAELRAAWESSSVQEPVPPAPPVVEAAPAAPPAVQSAPVAPPAGPDAPSASPSDEAWPGGDEPPEEAP